MMKAKYDKWTQNEDNRLTLLVNKYGLKKWKNISEQLNKSQLISTKRTSKQCRQRWIYTHDTEINRDQWTRQQLQLVMFWHAKLGTRWCQISSKMKGRTDHSIKNQFYSMIRKAIRQMCKMTSIKTYGMGVYEIKPITMTSIYLFNQNQVILELNNSKLMEKVNLLLSRYPAKHYNSIKCVVNQFIFNSNTQIRYDKQSIFETIKSIMEINYLLNPQLQLVESQSSNIQQQSSQMPIQMKMIQILGSQTHQLNHSIYSPLTFNCNIYDQNLSFDSNQLTKSDTPTQYTQFKQFLDPFKSIQSINVDRQTQIWQRNHEITFSQIYTQDIQSINCFLDFQNKNNKNIVIWE